MKVDRSERATAPATAPKSEFKQVIQHAVPAAAVKPHLSPVVSAPKSVAAAINQRLVTARVEINSGADRLVTVRKDGQSEQEQRVDSRVLDLICKELQVEFSAEPKRAANSDFPGRRQDEPGSAPKIAKVIPVSTTPVAQPMAQAPSGQRSSASLDASIRAAQAIELVEKIERLVKSARPALALTIGGGFAAQVEVERTGPKEVALKIKGINGPPKAEDLGRIREEIRSRGLKLSALSVG